MEVFYYLIAGVAVAFLIYFLNSIRISSDRKFKQKLGIQVVLKKSAPRVHLDRGLVECYELSGSGKLAYFFEYLVRDSYEVDPIDYCSLMGVFKDMYFEKTWLELNSARIFKELGPFVALIVDYNADSAENLGVECVYADIFDSDTVAKLKSIDFPGHRIYHFPKYDLATEKAVSDNSDGIIYDKFSLIIPARKYP